MRGSRQIEQNKAISTFHQPTFTHLTVTHECRKIKGSGKHTPGRIQAPNKEKSPEQLQPENHFFEEGGTLTAPQDLREPKGRKPQGSQNRISTVDYIHQRVDLSWHASGLGVNIPRLGSVCVLPCRRLSNSQP